MCITAGSLLRLVSSSAFAGTAGMALAGAVSGLWQLYMLYGGADRGRRWGRLVARGLDRLALVRRTARPGARARRIGQRVRRLFYRAARRVSDRDRRLAPHLCLAGCDLGRPDCAGRIFLVRDPARAAQCPTARMPVRSTARHRIQGRAGASPLPHRSTFLARDLVLWPLVVRGRHRLYPDCPLPGRERFHNRIGRDLRIVFGGSPSPSLALRPNLAAFGAIGPQSQPAAASLGFAANDRTTMIAVIVGLLGIWHRRGFQELIAVSVDLLGTRAAGP